MSLQEDIASVIALTLVDSSTLLAGDIVPDTRVWIGVRRSETNITHPDIVSVPTQRIPAALAESILGKNYWTRGKIEQLSPIWTASKNKNGHDLVIFAVKALLSMKVGVSDLLECGQIEFSATPALFTVNYAHYPNLIDKRNAPYPVNELLRMINLRVHIEKGCALFPKMTASYSHARWVRVQDYQRMMDGKDVSAIGLDGFKFCVDGLCIATTSQIIKQELDARAA